MKFKITKVSLDKDRFDEHVVEADRADGTAGNVRISGASVQEMFGFLLAEGATVELSVGSDSPLERIKALEDKVNEISVVGLTNVTATLEQMQKTLDVLVSKSNFHPNRS